MTKHTKKTDMLSDEDIKIIKSDPDGLANYVIRTKVKETRKTAIIAGLIAVVAAFAAGVYCGANFLKFSIPNNVVQITVGEKTETPQPEAVEK